MKNVGEAADPERSPPLTEISPEITASNLQGLI